MVLPQSFTHRISQTNEHAWITVVNPLNKSSVISACDHCGIVKSPDAIESDCSADAAHFLISRSNLAKIA